MFTSSDLSDNIVIALSLTDIPILRRNKCKQRKNIKLEKYAERLD